SLHSSVASQNRRLRSIKERILQDGAGADLRYMKAKTCGDIDGSMLPRMFISGRYVGGFRILTVLNFLSRFVFLPPLMVITLSIQMMFYILLFYPS
ncbi:unnamed protein product, partial [Brassica rapa subsp. narinosa]